MSGKPIYSCSLVDFHYDLAIVTVVFFGIDIVVSFFTAVVCTVFVLPYTGE